MVLAAKQGTPSKAAARKELARRKLAQQDLIRYGQYVMPGFRNFRHQRYLADKLREVERFVETGGKEGIGNLLVMMMPQVGKSTTISHLFPSFELGRHPDWPFILSSYNDQKATSNSRIVREIVSSKPYRPIFGDLANGATVVELSNDSRAVSEWRLANARGGVVAAGVGGGITGYPSKITIIDDPVKNREEADSEARQELVWDWLETSVQSRRQQGSALVAFNTRWSMWDMAGRIIRQVATNPLAAKWEIIFMPALALNEDEYPRSEKEQRERMAEEGVFLPMSDQLGRKPGEALCPELISLELLESIRDTMSPFNWMSLYQQMPFMRSGSKFKRSWFKISDLPDDIVFIKSVWYWDQAAKSGSGDFSVGVLMAIDQHERIWVLMVVRKQLSTFERRQEMRKAWEAAQVRFGNRLPAPPQLWHPQDPGSGGLDSARDTNKALAGLPAHFEPVSGDKEVRADPWSSALEGDNVMLLKAGWNQPFIDEHLLFPAGHDDQVDAASSAYTKLTGGIETGMAAYARQQLEKARAKAEAEAKEKELANG